MSNNTTNFWGWGPEINSNANTSKPKFNYDYMIDLFNKTKQKIIDNKWEWLACLWDRQYKYVYDKDSKTISQYVLSLGDKSEKQEYEFVKSRTDSKNNKMLLKANSFTSEVATEAEANTNVNHFFYDLIDATSESFHFSTDLGSPNYYDLNNIVAGFSSYMTFRSWVNKWGDDTKIIVNSIPYTIGYKLTPDLWVRNETYSVIDPTWKTLCIFQYISSQGENSSRITVSCSFQSLWVEFNKEFMMAIEQWLVHKMSQFEKIRRDEEAKVKEQWFDA